MELALPSPVNTTLKPAAAAAGPDRMTKAAEEFEAVYLATVIASLFKGLPTDGPFGGGHAEETFRGFLAEEYAAEVSRGGGIGIADAVFDELLKLQEGAQQ